MQNSTVEVPTVTVPCETGQHTRCRGQLVSLTVPLGTACACPCHETGAVA